MKTARNVQLTILVALAFALASCAPATESPAPILSMPPPPTAVPTAIPTPTLVTIPRAGPQSGNTITWIDNSTLVYVPPGEFQMGNNGADAPIHSVTLEGYWIQETKVTNRMYAQCVAVGACTPPAQEVGGPVFSNPGFANHPVVGVTWDQAQAYCTWMQGRLPTEAEWEKAARGTEGQLYPWGNAEPACDLLNFGFCIGHTTDVTSFPDSASPYGLLDMAGNVFEWVGDWYSETYYASSPLLNPGGPETGQYRVIRGSSFETVPEIVESAVRHFGAPAYHDRQTGFRCVVPTPQPLAPYCQQTAYVPSAIASSDGCQLPIAEVRGYYCAAGESFATVDIPDGAIYAVVGTDMKCTEAVVDGQRRLTCSGPPTKESTNEITVCNPACSNSPAVTGASPVCDPGYSLDPGSGTCNYTPIIGQVGVAGCPAGYVVLDSGGQKSCVIGLNANGQCPTGLYFDALVNACVSPGAQTNVPYGIDNPGLAVQTYAGCAPGYAYDPTFQCCQAVTGGTYPGCAPGTTFQPDLAACSAGEVKLSGPGCVTVSVFTLKCREPVDVCSKIASEARCITNAYACKWNEDAGVCELK